MLPTVFIPVTELEVSVNVSPVQALGDPPPTHPLPLNLTQPT